MDTPVTPIPPVTIKNNTKNPNFLVSFIADARGAAVTSEKNSLSLVVPPNAASKPTRFSCKPAKLSQGLLKFPSMLQHDATDLASQILELAPAEEVFLEPISITIPHFAALGQDFQREVVAFLSNDGKNWSLYDDHSEQKFEENFFTLKLKSLPRYIIMVTRPSHWASYVGRHGSLLKTGSKRYATADLTSELAITLPFSI